jgi:chaperone modulatory protein CbpM
MTSLDALITRIADLRRDDLLRWIQNDWVRPSVEDGQYAFEDIDVARVHLICELRLEMEIDEAALPVILSLLDQLYDLRRHVRMIDTAISDLVSSDVRRSLAERMASGI